MNESIAAESINDMVSVVVPCFNEQEVLPEAVRRFHDVCSSIRNPYEIVLVNDGSSDRTWELMLELQERYPHLVLINLARNYGHQIALTAGLQACRGSRILTIDADLQDPPELLPEMLRLMDEGADVVYGRRRHRAGEGLFKKLSARIFYRFINAMSDVELPCDTGDFRLFSRPVLDVFLQMPERSRYVRGMFSWIGFRQVPLMYDRDARFAGETKYPLRKMVGLALNATSSFSTKPLMMAVHIAVVLFFVGVILIGYALFSWLFLDTVRGWASMIGAISLIGSLQSIILAIFGCYLGRVYTQVQGRPIFVIREVRREKPASIPV